MDEKELREHIAQQIESFEIGELNGVGMKYIAARIARGLPVGIVATNE